MLHTYGDGEVTVRLIAAKVKVAPTKATSVPRLELVTAVLGLRLARTELLEIPFENYTYTLYTFYDVPNKLPPFGLSDHDTVAVQPLARQNLPKHKILLKSRDLQATNRMAMRVSRGSQPWSPGRSQRVMRRENAHARNNNQDRHGYLASPKFQDGHCEWTTMEQQTT